MIKIFWLIPSCHCPTCVFQADISISNSVCFNNDPKCAAIDNAITFGQTCDRIGLARTRTPGERPHLVEVA